MIEMLAYSVGTTSRDFFHSFQSVFRLEIDEMLSAGGEAQFSLLLPTVDGNDSNSKSFGVLNSHSSDTFEFKKL
jgi:hypothetical protein